MWLWTGRLQPLTHSPHLYNKGSIFRPPPSQEYPKPTSQYLNALFTFTNTHAPFNAPLPILEWPASQLLWRRPRPWPILTPPLQKDDLRLNKRLQSRRPLWLKRMHLLPNLSKQLQWWLPHLWGFSASRLSSRYMRIWRQFRRNGF